ncbi:hypothetical protein [Lysobacter sp. A3-1-A15]|uniref:hypothetical protein n=1 Tax=Novilysobacter viscosus TaxID=3098602 RepID=UPI002EDA254E
MKGITHHAAGAAVLLAVALAGCRPVDPAAAPTQPEATRPTEAVALLAQDLRRNDLAAYARHALPPDLHARVETRWREGATTWPLSELPLHAQVPAMLGALSAPDAEQVLMDKYRAQFAGAHGELRSTAAALGLFAAQYVQGEPRYSDSERDHYVQAIAALGRWGQQAPLGDPERAQVLLSTLAAAARATRIDGPEALAAAGMADGLSRLAPFAAAFKQVLAAQYGLDLDAALDSVQVDELDRTGDQARVRLRYTLAGTAVDTEVRVERRGERWYLTDLLRHALEQVTAADSTPLPAAPDVAPPTTAATD